MGCRAGQGLKRRLRRQETHWARRLLLALFPPQLLSDRGRTLHANQGTCSQPQRATVGAPFQTQPASSCQIQALGRGCRHTLLEQGHVDARGTAGCRSGHGCQGHDQESSEPSSAHSHLARPQSKGN